MLLFQDTETTGLLDYKKDLLDKTQPRICAMAALLTDMEGNIIDQMDTLIRPDDWPPMEEGAFRVHGLTKEVCAEKGIPMLDALARFNELKAQCTIRIGANISYDKRLLLREERIYGVLHDSDGKESVCVLQLARPICQIPNKDGKKGTKIPKLTEAYEYFFGEDMPDAHSALGDVKACHRVYFEIKRRAQAQ
jgi:DNA polymerase-3 subunit epsilon